MEKKDKVVLSLKEQSAWLLFAKVAGYALSFLLPLLVVRFLAQEKVGVYRQVFQIVVNAAAILPFGVSMSAYYFLSRETERRASSIANILIFNFVVGGLACAALFAYPQLIGNIFQSQEITQYAPLIGIVIWLWIFSSFLEIVAVANQESRMATTFIILAQFTKTLFMVSAAFFFATVASFIYAAIIQGTLQTIILIIYLHSRFPQFWRSFNLNFFREQLVYALPFGFAGVLWTLQTDIHNYFVGYRFNSAEYAIYAYGCFELPLIGMISEAVASVLIPRMSVLQAENDKAEIFRLATRATQKLAFFFFPIYGFLLITAQTFIVTLFTRDYLASIPIFIINLTILPFYVWINDPIVRAYKELGRFLLKLRVFIFTALVTSLYFGIQRFDMSGMISIVVVTLLFEKLILTIVILRKLEVRKSDFYLLKDTAKTAFCALLAGAFTFLFYWQTHGKLAALGADFGEKIFGPSRANIVDSVSGIFVLGSCFLIMAPIYLFSANYLGIVDEGEKQIVGNLIDRIFRNRSEAKSSDLRLS